MNGNVFSNTVFETCRIFMILIIILIIILKKIIHAERWLVALLFTAFRAQAKYVQFVVFLDIAVFFDKLILDFLKLRAVNLFEFPAFCTNQVVVVLVAVLMLETL